MCDEEWLPKSMPSDFRLSPPQGGQGVCENCAKKKLHEEPFEKKGKDYQDGSWSIKTTEIPQQESFSYDCFATTTEPSGPWEQEIPGSRGRSFRPRPGRSEHCRRLLQITIPCCLENCENEDVIVHFTENTVRKWGEGPLLIWFEQGSLWYKSAYYECCGIKHPTNDGDEVEEWSDRFCEAEGHECESCKDWFENRLYTYDDELLKSAYLDMKADPSRENRKEYRRLAMHLRRTPGTKKRQIALTTNILDAFLGEDPPGCIRRGLTVGPWNESSGSMNTCGFQVQSRNIEIPLPGGRFIGNGYLCEDHS